MQGRGTMVYNVSVEGGEPLPLTLTAVYTHTHCNFTHVFPPIYIYNESLQAAHASEPSLYLEGLSHVRPPTPSSLAHLHTPSFPLWAALCFPNHADVRGSDDDAINVVKSKAALNPTLETLTEASEKVMACSTSPTVVLTMEAGLAMNRKAAALLHGTASLTKNLFCCALFNFCLFWRGWPSLTR